MSVEIDYAELPWPGEEPDHKTAEDGRTALERLRAALVDSAGLDDIAEPTPLVAGVLYRDSTAWLIGKPGHAKSFLAIDFTGCVATGEPWQGRPVSTGPVLYLAAEGASGVRGRVRAWEKAMDRPMTGVQWLPIPVQANTAEWAALVDLARELQPALIVLDTQARVTVGLEENSAKDMGFFVHQVERLRLACGACVLTAHHQGRNGEHGRGSTAIDGAATTVIRVEKDESQVRVMNPKQKDAEEFEDITLRLVPMLASAVLMQDSGGFVASAGKRTAATKMARSWWDLHGTDWCSATRLIGSQVAPETTFYRNVKELVTAGLAEKDGNGRITRYRLPRDPGS